MPESTSSPIQPEQPTVSVPQPKTSKKLSVVMLLIVIVLLFAGLGTGTYYLLTRNKKEATPTTSERQSCTYNNQAYNDSDSFDATDGCNTCLCNNGTVVCTELDCTEESNGDNDGDEADPYKDWQKITSNWCKVSFYLPPTWYEVSPFYSGNCESLSTVEDPAALGGMGIGGFPGVMMWVESWMAEDQIDYPTPQSFYDYLVTTPAGQSQLTIGTMTIDNQDALYIINDDPIDGTHYVVYYQSNNSYYGIHWGGAQVSEYQDDIDKILASVDIL